MSLSNRHKIPRRLVRAGGFFVVGKVPEANARRPRRRGPPLLSWR